MTTMRPTTLLAVATVGFAIGWLLLTAGAAVDWALLSPPITLIGVTALLAVGTLAAAWPLRQWNLGNRVNPINPLRAARTVALAKAAGLTGAATTGLWVASAAFVLPRLGFDEQSERFVGAIAAIAVSVALVIAGVVAERWCRIPPDPSEPA